ncbi:MAG: HD domain-containing protein [Candidatus Bipolaricaulota bacterium]|nr:HD domain-containing protein [Candidatus Bipolaricaulota bacterium]
MCAEKLAQYLHDEVPYPLMHVLIKDMRPGQRISQCFLAKQKTQRATRKGDAYLEIVLADKSGTIPARAWAEATQRYASQFDESDFVFVEGRTETYRNTLQIIVESIRRLEIYEQERGKIGGFDPGLLVQASDRDIDEMWNELTGLISSISSEPLRELTVLLTTENEEAFRTYPAAVHYHHAYLGGLLEHTLEVASGVHQYAKTCSTLDQGMATAGGILHDIGKVKELEKPIAPRYSFDGQLLGHLLLGRDMVRDAAKRISWPDPQIPELLEHIIISHHGELEFGAAIVPKTAEAIAVYYFDNLSARLNMVKMHIARDNEEGDFTDWHSLLGRKFFKGTGTGN